MGLNETIAIIITPNQRCIFIYNPFWVQRLAHPCSCLFYAHLFYLDAGIREMFHYANNLLEFTVCAEGLFVYSQLHLYRFSCSAWLESHF